METIESRKVTLKFHKFYCDDCGKFLREHEEDSTGHYKKSFSFHTVSVNNPDVQFSTSKKFKLDGVFCDSCNAKRYDKLCEILEDHGFKEIQWCKSEFCI